MSWDFKRIAGLPILAQSQTSRVVGQVKDKAALPERKRWAARTHELLDALQASGLNLLESRLDQLEEFIACMDPRLFAQEYVAHRAEDQRLFVRECIRRQTGILIAIRAPDKRIERTMIETQQVS